MNKKLIALSLALVLCLGLMAGCTKKESEPPVTPTPEAAQPETPTDTPDIPDEPEDTANPDDPLGWDASISTGETKTFEVSIEGQSVPVEMTKHTLTLFSNGMSIDIYVDTALYKVSIFEGEYDISPIEKTEDAPEMSETFINFCYLSDASADQLKEQALGGRRDGSTVTDGGMVKLSDYDAYLVSYLGKDCEYYGSAYFIPLSSGTLLVGTRLDGESPEGHGPRFEAMLNTMKIVEA